MTRRSLLFLVPISLGFVVRAEESKEVELQVSGMT